MGKTDATVLKLNQFIEPKTTFAAFLSEGVKEKWNVEKSFISMIRVNTK